MDQPVLTDLFVVEVEQLPRVDHAEHHRKVNELRDKMIKQVAQHADDQRPGFTEDARRYILEHLRIYGRMTGEELTMKCKDAGIVPHDDRGFGGVFMSLSRRGLIVRVGEAKRLRGHNCNGGSIWDLKR